MKQLQEIMKKKAELNANKRNDRRISEVFMRKSVLNKDRVLAGALLPKDRNKDSQDLAAEIK